MIFLDCNIRVPDMVLNLSGRWANNDKYKPLNPKYYLNRPKWKYSEDD